MNKIKQRHVFFSLLIYNAVMNVIFTRNQFKFFDFFAEFDFFLVYVFVDLPQLIHFIH